MERAALVTGGAGALGSAVTAAFLDDGWRVAVPLHSADGAAALADAAARHGERLTTFQADLTDEQGARDAVDKAAEWGGGLHAVVHTVGGWAGGHLLEDTPAELWDRMMDVNLRSAFLVARAALGRLDQSGTMVFVSSRAALRGRSGNAAYAVAKSALLTLVEAIAEENKGGVRANAVLPDTIDTAANRAAMPNADAAAWTRPEDIARVILFLASPASAPVTGAAVPVHP